jgi:peroxiredoxin
MSVSVTLSHAALWILVILQGVVLLGLVRVVHQLQQGGAIASRPTPRAERLAGQRAPEFTAVDVSGKPVASGDFAGRLTALLFVSPKCSSCVVTLEELQALQSKADGNVVVVCQAGAEDCQRMVRDYDLTVPVVADPDEELGKRYDITAPPTAVLISEGGHILQYGHPERGEDLEGLLRAPEAAVGNGEAR